LSYAASDFFHRTDQLLSTTWLCHFDAF